MNNKGQVWALVIFVAFIFLIGILTTITPLKESLSVIRGGSFLNCADVSDFNQVTFDNQTRTEKLTYRPTCFVTGMSMVWFVFAFLSAVAAWTGSNILKSIGNK